MKYGPPELDLPRSKGCKDPRYTKHASYCKNHHEVSWDEYVKLIDEKKNSNKFGRPGQCDPGEAKNHSRFCDRLGHYVDWDSYEELKRKAGKPVQKKKGPPGETPRAMAERVLREKGLDKFNWKG